MAVIVHQAVTIHPDLAAGGVAEHELDGLAKVLVVAVDPLPVIAPLGDGVELLGQVVALLSHPLSGCTAGQ